MQSQIPEIQKNGCIESQASTNSIATKATNNQIVAVTKRKQNIPPVLQIKSSSTTDLSVVNALYKIAGPTTKSTNSNSPARHGALHSKSQQINPVRQVPLNVPGVSPSNGRTDISDDQILSCPVYQTSAIAPPYAPPSIVMSSPHIVTQNSNYHNLYHTYQPQVQAQQPQSQPCQNDTGNRQNYSNKHNASNNNNKKMYNPNYTKSKRNGSNSSSASDKVYNNNNNNNNNTYERNVTTRSGSHLNQQISRNGNRSYSSTTIKHVSPSRDHYSSSSSSSSSSSLPLTKKSMHHLHSPINPQLIPSISFQEDSRTIPMTYGYEQYLHWNYRSYPEKCQSQMYSIEIPRNNGYPIGRSMSHQQQFTYSDTSTGEFITIPNVVDGKSNHRVNRANRGNQKNGSTFKRYTPPDRFMNRAPYVEIKDKPKYLTNDPKWDTLSIQVWEKFLSCQQKEGTYTKKIKLWKNMYCAVQESFSDYSLYMVGSTISGFGTDVSDVDMCLVNSSKNGQIYFGSELRHKSAAILKEFEELLRRNSIYGDFNLIPAKVPILRFKDTFHEFEIDLNYNNFVGIQNTHLMYCYGRVDTRMRPLALVVKIWAQYHGINNAKEMTISSYSLVLMVIHFLQCGVSPPVLPCLHDLYPNKFQKYQEIKSIDMNEDLAPWYSQNKQALGELFFEFFRYYTNFDFSNRAISVRKGCTIPIEVCKTNNSPKNDQNQWKELCIEEPFDFTNTAHSCYDPYKFQWIRRVFSTSYEALLTTRDLKSIFEKLIVPIMPNSFQASYHCEEHESDRYVHHFA